jgi:hypothetical protein
MQYPNNYTTKYIMKKLLFPIIILFVAVSCSRQNKAEQIITNLIQSELKEGCVYTPIKFTKLSEVLSAIDNEDEYKKIKEEFDKVEYKYLFDSISSAENYKRDSSMYGKKFADATYIKPLSYDRDKLRDKLEELKRKYQPYVTGKGLIHIYIYETPFGDSLLYSKFVFDDNFNIKDRRKISIEIDRDSISYMIEKIQNEQNEEKDKDFLNNDFLWSFS